MMIVVAIRMLLQSEFREVYRRVVLLLYLSEEQFHLLADNPCLSLCALHALYVITGNRSLTSSIFNNFFSRLLR